jgi:hypothetical protein
MATLTVRITKTSHDTLKQLADRSGRPMQDLLDEAVEELRRKQFFEELNAAYARLKSDPKQWKEELAERAAWEATLRDGLEG